MARGLRNVLEDLERGRLPASDLRDHPEELIEEVRLRLLPGVMLLPAPSTQPVSIAPAPRPAEDESR